MTEKPPLVSRDQALAAYMQEAQTAMFLFQMIEESLKAYLTYAYETIRVSLPAGVTFRASKEEYENAPLDRLLTYFARVTPNEPLLRSLNQVRESRNYCAHRAFALAFLSEVRAKGAFEKEFAKVQAAREGAGQAFNALNVELKAIGTLRNATLHAKRVA